MNMAFTLRKTTSGVLFFLGLSFIWVSCALLQLREEPKSAKKSIVLVGAVSSTLSVDEMPVVVAAYSE
jgi:hypothetical protein